VVAIEQQIYAVVGERGIAPPDFLCSGFCEVPPPA
jgi:hypothetical protein